MPIKDKSLYPADWEELATQIKESDRWYCVECRRPCRRSKVSKRIKELETNYKEERKTKVETVDQFKFRLANLSEIWYFEYCEKPQAFTLTVSHQDHDTTNNVRSNLKSLCSGCHCRYDAAHHAATRAKNAAAILSTAKTVKAKPAKTATAETRKALKEVKASAKPKPKSATTAAKKKAPAKRKAK